MLFRRNPRRTRENLENQINDLLMAAEMDGMPGSEAAAFNTAGDLSSEAGISDKALSYYGLAIDAFLKVERWDAAAAVCRKVLRLSPRAVRARCTLAWLAIGKEMPAEAQVQIRSYVDAAVKAGREPLAVAQLKRMGDAAPSPSVREEVADRLLALGADRAADHVFGTVYRDRQAGRDSGNTDLLWSTVRRAALMGPSDLVARR
jgi:hypothetical protein